jgi:hypothetical protein
MIRSGQLTTNTLNSPTVYRDINKERKPLDKLGD